jgi:hypothetical protein
MVMKTIAQQLNAKQFPFTLHDDKGNKIYQEAYDGSWTRREYDSQGNKLYLEDSNGYWEKFEYDSNGYIIYHESVTGYWFKKEYDSQGNLIYFENSKGKIIDNRPKPSCEGKTIEIDGVEYKLVKE